jgi:PhnB protein
MMYRDAEGALRYVKSVFGAVERECFRDAEGNIRHAEFTIGDSAFMLSQETSAYPTLRSVEAFGGSPIQVFLYLDDVDSVVERAVAAGAEVRFPVDEKPYGRSCGFADPYGLVWWVTTPPAPK